MKKIALFLGVMVTSLSALFSVEPQIELWGSAVSPYVRKVISVLEEKELSYQWHPILPAIIIEAKGEKAPEAFMKASPLGKIPALQVNDFSISDSSVISAYLEKKWPTKPLYPRVPEEMAEALWFEKYADTTMTEVFHKLLVENYVKPKELNLKKDEAVIQQLLEKMPPILTYLNTKMIDKKFLIGSKISIADISVVHHFLSLKIAEVEIDLSPYPALVAYLENLLTHPSIQKAMRI